MGNLQLNAQKYEVDGQRQVDKWNVNAQSKQNFDLDEKTHVQLFETKNFMFSKLVLASRNLMGSDALACEAAQVNLNIFNFFEQLSKSGHEEDTLILPILNSFFSDIKIKRPLYQMIEIDPKKFILTRSDAIKSSYRFVSKIGQGSYGVVFKGESLSQRGDFRAIKQIQKTKMNNQSKLSLINQFQILKKLDHPNIIKLYEIFEDREYFYVVSELCQGGNLIDFLNKHKIGEGCIKIIMRQILSAVNYMHNLQILHRDLKLENVVVVENKLKKSQVEIKIIDFGLSVDLSKVKQFIVDEVAGSLIYMSPESLSGTLTLASDIWSCGIILYMMATKKLPYKYKNEDELISKIEKGYISRKYLHPLNLKLKMVINLMIESDVSRRFSANKTLQSEWFRTNDEPVALSAIQRKKAAASLFSYDIKNNLFAMIESYIAFKRITQSERQRLAKIFKEIDKDKSGVIDIEQFKEFYAEYSQNYNEKEVEDLLKIIDKNRSGLIDFNEFISAIYSRRKLFEVKNLEDVFGYLDRDNSGSIEKNELKSILVGIEDEEIEYLFAQLDKNQDNVIEKSELISYIQKQYHR